MVLIFFASGYSELVSASAFSFYPERNALLQFSSLVKSNETSGRRSLSPVTVITGHSSS